MLETREISKHFGGLIAVNGISVSINQNECVGLIGPNGAGKTTFFNLLTGFLRPSSGRIDFKGEDITKIKPYDRAKKGLARTFQIVQPFPKLTVMEHVLLGLLMSRHKRGKEMRIIEAEKIITAVQLLDKSEIQAQFLSHGELRRLEIARALAVDPSMLLLDEPFGGLSQQEIEPIKELINQLHAKGVTILIIEHVLKIVMNLCQRIIVLNEGRILAQGTPREIADNQVVIEAYLGKNVAGLTI